jgi:TIR domain
MINAFLSHKQDFAAQAEALANTLRKLLPCAHIFRSEDIEKGRDWRAAINAELAAAKCFILLYTDPELDWSWCFYEAGAFVSKGRKRRPVFCLHPETVDPPSPLAHLQAIRGEQTDVAKWIYNDLCRALGCRKPKQDELDSAADSIAKLVNTTESLQERVIKPYIWIDPMAGQFTELEHDRSAGHQFFRCSGVGRRRVRRAAWIFRRAQPDPAALPALDLL